MHLAVNSRRLGLRDKAFTLGALAGQFTCTADCLGLPAGLGLGRLLESSAGLHFPEDALALHLLLERLQRLIDVVIADHDLNYLKLSIGFPAGPFPGAPWDPSSSEAVRRTSKILVEA